MMAIDSQLFSIIKDLGFLRAYKVLARVPALSCRLGRVPCDRALSAFAGGCASYNRAFGTLIVHSLSITKKFDQRKQMASTRIKLLPSNLGAKRKTNIAHWTFLTRSKKCSIYYQLCLGCGFAGM